MRGCRPLNVDEFQQVYAHFHGRLRARDRALWILGCNTGFRISELLSLNLGDVVGRDGKIVDRVTVSKSRMKGRLSSRTILLNEGTRTTLAEWCRELNELGGLIAETPLFCNTQLRRLTRGTGYRILTRAFLEVGLSGKLGTHSMRKTFANNVYGYFMGRLAAGQHVDPLRATSKALGHASINNTDFYLSFSETDVDQAVLAIGAQLAEHFGKTQTNAGK